MLRLFVFIAELFLLLPWWAAVGVLAALFLGLVVLAKYIVYRLHRDIINAVLEKGTPLENADLRVYSVKSAPAPTEKSLLDLDPDDEEYDAELDESWPDEGWAHYLIDVAITPQSSDASWNPGVLTLVSADFEPQEELEFCEQTCLLHSVWLWQQGEFVPWGDEPTMGNQRLRLLVAVPPGLVEAKFGYHFTYFGHVALPNHVGAH